MERGASSVLPARDARAGATIARRNSWAVRGRRLRHALADLADSCALAGVALLACVALIAVGTVASLLWTFVAQR